jgi:acetolactate synthase-1/2/3 large subunit
MRVSDYIFKFLTDRGVDTVFMVSGGQAMFLVDALYKHPTIKVICTHHEQAAAMAAEAYGRITGKLGVALVTAGPGSMNATNGLVGGWTDSAPMMIISGQSALNCVQYQAKTKIRQYGIQSINIKPMVENATKRFMTIDDPSKISIYMGEAYHLATTGRPGPVWIDVPLDVQRMEVPLNLLSDYTPPPSNLPIDQLKKDVAETLRLLKQAKRPIVIAGQGVRSAHAIDEFMKAIARFNIPTLTSRLGIDLIESEHPLYIGRPGNYGERSANFAIQNADLILALGSRLASALVGHDPKNFGKNATKVMVDIDREELDKPKVEIQVKIQNDVKLFINELLKQAVNEYFPDYSDWVKTCQSWKHRYPVMLEEYKNEKPVNSYYFTYVLTKLSTSDDIILVDQGSCFHVACQSWKVKKNQRFLTTGGLSSMGYWAAGLGACLANKGKRTLVITGDGSLQMNIQELATIKHNNLNMKIFIFNNNGYLLIRFTQKNLMEGRLIGEGPETGVWCPDSLKIAEAYGIPGVRIGSPENLEQKIQAVLDMPGPVICDVMTPEWQLIVPRVSSEKKPDGTLVSKPYEDMFPFLSREEYLANMIVKPSTGEKKITGAH